ncbi:MAG: PEP/pyruvate-binding domain-containing protein [Legionella sp.]
MKNEYNFRTPSDLYGLNMIHKAENKERAAIMGNKAANLVELNNLFDNVPSFLPLVDALIKHHLDQHAPAWHDEWMAFKTAQGHEKNELRPDAIVALHRLQELIHRAFQEHSIQNNDLVTYLKTMQDDGSTSFMVRSSGEEDTVELANPGGNESIFNVAGTVTAISSAIGRVVASYFSEKSLKQRLLSSQHTITESSFMPVIIQRMIGESPGNIICSGVMYTHSDMMAIQAAPGIAAVTNSDLAFDTFSVTNSGTIYSEIAQKNHRFVPRQDNLVFVQNPQALKNSPALSSDVILRLASMGRAIEAHYGMSMDVEFIYEPQKDMIYLVQARPIPSGRVKQVIPSAIPPEKMAMIRDELKNNSIKLLKAHVVSAGGNAAKVINQQEQLLICDTVQEALTRYLKHKNSPVQAVIVKEISPEMSHPVAQLNANGIPVLQINEIRALHDWVTSRNWPIVIDVQRGLLIDWSKKIALTHHVKQALFDAGILKNGLFSHPVRPVTAMPLDFMRHQQALSPFLQQVHEQLLQSDILPIQKTRIFSQLSDCIELIEATHPEKEKTQAIQALNTARQLFYQMAKFFYDKHEPSTFFSPAMVVCDDIMHCLQTTPLNYPYLLQLTAKLSSLVTYHGSETIFSASIKQTALESKVIKKALAQLSIKKLTSEQLSYYTQFLKFEVLAFSPIVKQEWRKFIFNCVQDSKSTQSLAQMISFYRQHHIESDWLHFSFAKAIKNNNSLSSLEEEFLVTKTEIETLKLNRMFHLIQYWESQIHAWQNPDQFDFLWENYARDMQALLTQLTSKTNLQPLSKKALFATVNALTDMMDRTIKSLKGSPEYNDKINLQVERFAKLLSPYSLLMQHLMRAIPDEQYIKWSQKVSYNYYNHKEPMLKAINDKFSECTTKLEAQQLNASGSFSVNAVRVGSTASFERQFVGSRDVTLEDLFTLMHQNILSSIQYFTRDTWPRPSHLPEIFKPFLEQAKKMSSLNGIDLQLLVIKYQYPIVELDYNIPLSNHSASCLLKYNASTDRLQFKFQLFGRNWADRMDAIVMLAHIEGQLFGAEVKESPMYSAQKNTMELTWEFSSKQAYQASALLLDSIKQYCKMTDYVANSDNAINDLFQQADKLFLRHSDVMRKIALFLRLSREERHHYRWMEQALLRDFIVGASEPDTQLACQEVLKNFAPEIFQEQDAISTHLSLLPLLVSDAGQPLIKRIVTIIDYYLAQGALFNPFNDTVLDRVSRYPQLLPSYLNYLKTHQNEYRGIISINQIMTLADNQQVVSEMVHLGIIDPEKLHLAELEHNQLIRLLHNSIFKERWLPQLYENSLSNREPNIQSISSAILHNYNRVFDSENGIGLLLELLTVPLYQSFVMESIQMSSISKQYLLFQLVLKKNYLELCKWFLQSPHVAKQITDEIWSVVLELDELSELVVHDHTFVLNTTYDNFFHEKLFTSLKHYLDCNPLQCTPTQLIKLLQWKDQEKQQAILNHPNLSWKKSVLEQPLKKQMDQLQVMEQGNEQIDDEPWGRSFHKRRIYTALKSKLEKIDQFWQEGDDVSSNYAVRELFFKSEWIPKPEELSYADYIKYQYDITHVTSLPRLPEAIEAGDIETIKYYLSQKIPKLLAENLVLLALKSRQLRLANYLISQHEYDLTTDNSLDLFYFAAQNGDVMFWQCLLTSERFEHLPHEIYVIEDSPIGDSLLNLYAAYEQKNPVNLLDYLIKNGKNDIVMIILESKKIDWPFFNEEQEQLISHIEQSGDPEIIQFVLKKLNLTSEDRVWLAQSLQPSVELPDEQNRATVINANAMAPAKKNIQLIQDIYQQRAKNEATLQALTKLKDIANQACYQNVNCITLNDYQVLQQSYKDYLMTKTLATIESELNGLREKIGTVDKHYCAIAQKQAQELLEELEQHKIQYQMALQQAAQLEEITVKAAGEQFNAACKLSIEKAKPILERDLSWGDYLRNLVNALANAIIKIATFGYSSSFFSHKTAESLDIIDQIEHNLRIND